MNPTTKETIRSYELMSEEAAIAAVESCHAAYLEWRKTSHEERAKVLMKMAKALRDNAQRTRNPDDLGSG